MKPNLNKMTKGQILELFNYKCTHGHNGLSHYNCYMREEKKEERVGCLDIEASNLKANFGIILSWAIKPLHEEEIYYDVITKRDLKAGVMDRDVVATLLDTIDTSFDRVVTWYGTKFDIPYIRSRALYHGLEHYKFGEVLHTDAYYMARSKLCIHSNRQGVVGGFLSGEDIKTKIDFEHWLKALTGNEKSLAYILDHNLADVQQLEDNYLKLRDFVKINNRSA